MFIILHIGPIFLCKLKWLFNIVYSLYFFKCKLILTIKSQIMKAFEPENSLHYSCTIFIPLCIRAVTQTKPNTDFVVFIGRHILGWEMTTTFIFLSWCSAFCTEKGFKCFLACETDRHTRGHSHDIEASSASVGG